MGWGCGWRNIMMIASNLVRREVRRALHHAPCSGSTGAPALRGAARRASPLCSGADAAPHRRRSTRPGQHRPALSGRRQRRELKDCISLQPASRGQVCRVPSGQPSVRAARPRTKRGARRGRACARSCLAARASCRTYPGCRRGWSARGAAAWTPTAATSWAAPCRARTPGSAPPRPPRCCASSACARASSTLSARRPGRQPGPATCHFWVGRARSDACRARQSTLSCSARLQTAWNAGRAMPSGPSCSMWARVPREPHANARAPPRAGTDDSRDLKRQKSRPADARCQRGGFEQSFPQEYARGNGAAGGAEAGAQGGPAQGGPAQGGPAQVHSTVECDGCGASPIRGTRFQSKARPAPACAHAWSARTWSCTLRRDGMPGTRQRCSGAQLRGASGGCHRALQARRMGHQQAAAFVHRLKRLPRSLPCAGC